METNSRCPQLRCQNVLYAVTSLCPTLSPATSRPATMTSALWLPEFCGASWEESFQACVRPVATINHGIIKKPSSWLVAPSSIFRPSHSGVPRYLPLEAA